MRPAFPKLARRARSALLLERLRTKEVGGCWQLRQSPGATFWSQAKRAGLPRRLGTLLVAHAAEYFLLITSWWLIGRAALSGHLDHGWLLAWALICLRWFPSTFSAPGCKALSPSTVDFSSNSGCCSARFV